MSEGSSRVTIIHLASQYGHVVTWNGDAAHTSYSV